MNYIDDKIQNVIGDIFAYTNNYNEQMAQANEPDPVEYAESVLKQTLKDCQKREREKAHAEIIADLFMIRSKLTTPLSAGELTPPDEILKYNWINKFIAVLMDKYSITDKDVEKALRNYQPN